MIWLKIKSISNQSSSEEIGEERDCSDVTFYKDTYLNFLQNLNKKETNFFSKKDQSTRGQK